MSDIDRAAAKAAVNPDKPRLPCRGCTADCSNYQRCEGRPWRTLYEQPTGR